CETCHETLFPAKLPEIQADDMDQAVERHRRRMHLKGFVRVEVRVRREDTNLLRAVARALSDPGREAAMRTLLQAQLPPEPGIDLKALLAGAPLDGVDLTRPRDMGRAVDL
ncbi:MAG: hypothetical protein ABW026_14565, partial [Microvirga sp.]